MYKYNIINQLKKIYTYIIHNLHVCYPYHYINNTSIIVLTMYIIHDYPLVELYSIILIIKKLPRGVLYTVNLNTNITLNNVYTDIILLQYL